jgi:hypothetical protein
VWNLGLELVLELDSTVVLELVLVLVRAVVLVLGLVLEAAVVLVLGLVLEAGLALALVPVPAPVMILLDFEHHMHNKPCSQCDRSFSTLGWSQKLRTNHFSYTQGTHHPQRLSTHPHRGARSQNKLPLVVQPRTLRRF